MTIAFVHARRIRSVPPDFAFACVGLQGPRVMQVFS